MSRDRPLDTLLTHKMGLVLLDRKQHIWIFAAVSELSSQLCLELLYFRGIGMSTLLV